MSMTGYISPQWPDLHICSHSYGNGIVAAHCQTALEDIRFKGTNRRAYPVGAHGQLFGIPSGRWRSKI